MMSSKKLCKNSGTHLEPMASRLLKCSLADARGARCRHCRLHLRQSIIRPLRRRGRRHVTVARSGSTKPPSRSSPSSPTKRSASKIPSPNGGRSPAWSSRRSTEEGEYWFDSMREENASATEDSSVHKTEPEDTPR